MRNAVLPAPLGPPPSSGQTLMIDPGPRAAALMSGGHEGRRKAAMTPQGQELKACPQLSSMPGFTPIDANGGDDSVKQPTIRQQLPISISHVSGAKLQMTPGLPARAGAEPRAWKSGNMTMSSAASTIDALINRVGGVNTPFSIELPDGEKRNLGEGAPEFSVGLRNERALRALRTLDEGNIAEAYLQGDIDIEGDMLKPFALRAHLDDRHPLVSPGASSSRCCSGRSTPTSRRSPRTTTPTRSCS